MPDPDQGRYMSAEQLHAALTEAGVPVAAAGPDGGAAKLREYWVHGPGAAQIRWGSAGDFDRCVMHLGKYVADPKGLCNTYHQEALGAPPGKGHAAAAPEPVTSLRGVELARPGTFALASGKTTFTEQMLADAADFYAATGRGAIPVGLGHMDQRFDGDPAFGWVENIRYQVDARGPVLLGDLVDMPGWLAAEAPKRWRNRSIEAFSNVEFGGRTYAMALTRLALLGATPPGIPSISSLSDLQTALAASTRLVASIADPEPPEPPPAAPPPAPSDQEGAGMDPAKLREALGLPPEASDQEVTSAIAAAGLTPPPSAPPTAPLTPQFVAPTPTPPQPVQDIPQATPQAVAASGGLRQLPPGTVVIDATQLAEFQAGMQQSQKIAASMAKRDRDDTIAAAVAAGKFPPARRQHWEQLWDADPDGTREVLDRLQANLVPVQASGYPGGGEPADLEYAQFAHLFPPEPQQQGGGRRG